MRIFTVMHSIQRYMVVLFFSTICVGSVSAQTFQVSAYYSPLPNQYAYVSGSYAQDLRMNGNGTHGADGTAVYVGMISAPSKYSFGTKIYIPGLGVGTVHDRGGVIYSTKGYDRLDIWMGYGDEGRIRALKWGRQMVEGEIVDVNTQEGFVFDGVVVTDENKNISVDYFRTNLWLSIQNTGEIKKEIKKIQEFLGSRQTGYYGGRTQKFVLDFQLQYGIVHSSSDVGAGTWGPKTRKVANRIFQERKEERKEGGILGEIEKSNTGVEVSTSENVRK